MERDGHIAVRREIGSGERASDAVVVAVSKIRRVGPTDLEPLTRTIDSDALDALVESMEGDGRLSFQYQGCEVVVEGDGVVKVTRS